MGKTTGFLEFARIDPQKRPPEDRIKDWAEISLPQDPEIVVTQGARCMNCGVPFCQGGVILEGGTSGCPLHNLIPEWNGLVYEGQWEDAYKRLTRTNPFPEFTARVCPAPCEGSCTEGHIMEPVTINSLEYEIIERAFAEGWVVTKKAPATSKRIAIVGSGPAGMSAAHYLNLVGHDVTVLERDDRAGGLMMYGIPNMKLEKRYVERRLDLMKAAGIRFVLNTEVGKDISAQELVDEFDAVLLCAGATKGRRLDIEGQELQGVHLAVDFLKASTQSLLDSNLADGCYPSAQGKHVIVIGGGDTGTDCVATSIRLGCASVCQFEIMPEPPKMRIEASNPWPEWPNKLKVDYGQEEALSLYGEDPRRYLTSTKIIVGNDRGAVEAVRTVAINWEKDVAGRLVPQEVPGSEKVWKADLVLLALGFLGPEDSLPDELMLARDTRSNVKAEYEVFKTNVDKVFVAGDMRRGQSLIVWAQKT
ncbi:MAG: glutamate synthase subunit beta [Firmicutes bacterium]|nr:glutamate synthase subunit beta [Bacillota bacterium]